MKYRRIPIEVEASRWFHDGDHPKVVNYSSQEIAGNKTCLYCSHMFYTHGWISTPKGHHLVCPADWIINFGNYHETIKPARFDVEYESA